MKPLIYPKKGIHNAASVEPKEADEFQSGNALQTVPIQTQMPQHLSQLSSLAAGAAPYKLASNSNPDEDPTSKFYFDTTLPLDFKAYLGSKASLVCRLRRHQPGNDQLQVSWVRNVSILTSGEFRYTSDQRFNPLHLAGTQDWRLEIESVQLGDEGTYECQVNSEPMPASVRINLHVISMSIEILESPQVILDEGEDIKLTCRVQFNSSTMTGNSKFTDLLQSHYIYWLHNGSISLSYNNLRGGITIETRETGNGLESRLLVREATREDSGHYSCKIALDLDELKPAQTRVLVGADPLEQEQSLISMTLNEDKSSPSPTNRYLNRNNGFRSGRSAASGIYSRPSITTSQPSVQLLILAAMLPLLLLTCL